MDEPRLRSHGGGSGPLAAMRSSILGKAIINRRLNDHQGRAGDGTDMQRTRCARFMSILCHYSVRTRKSQPTALLFPGCHELALNGRWDWLAQLGSASRAARAQALSPPWPRACLWIISRIRLGESVSIARSRSSIVVVSLRDGSGWRRWVQHLPSRKMKSGLHQASPSI